MSELEMLCFDVLGDFMDPQTISVDEEGGTVTVREYPPHLMGLLHEEWRHATVCTEFERVKLRLKLPRSKGASGAREGGSL